MKKIDEMHDDSDVQMSDSDRLISEITAEAEKEEKRILDDAAEQIRKKQDNTDRQCSQIISEAEKKAEKQAANIHRQKESSLTVEKKRIFLNTQEKVSLEVLDIVRENFRKMSGSDKYRDILKDWIIEAFLGLGCEEAEINTTEEEKKIIDRNLLSSAEKELKTMGIKKCTLVLSKEVPIKSQGVILKNSTGKLVYNNTVEARLNRKIQYIRSMVASEILSAGQEKGDS